MNELQIICMPFLLALLILTMAMMYYQWYWKKTNPWWRQDDRKMSLSPVERNYRQKERRCLNNALMCWFAVFFIIIGLMVIVLSARISGGFAGVGKYWFYLIPFIGGVFLALSGLHRRG